MAILKVKKVKRKDYYSKIQYMIVMSNEDKSEFLIDNYGTVVPRDNYSLRLYDPTGLRLPAYSWEEYAYISDCNYNNSYNNNDINMIDIIIGFKERYVANETMFEIAELFAEKYLNGNLVLIALHDSQHIHLLVKRLRLLDIEPCEEWMELDKKGRIKPCEYKAGCLLRIGRKKLKAMKAYIMELCQERGLSQIDLLKKNPVRTKQVEYEMARRGVKSNRELLKSALEEVMANAKTDSEFESILQSNDVERVQHKGLVKYMVGNADKPISGGALGNKYKIEKIYMEICLNAEKEFKNRPLKKRREDEMFGLDWYTTDDPIIEYKISRYNEDGERRTLLESLIVLAIVLIEGEIPEWAREEKKYVKSKKEIEKLEKTRAFIQKYDIATIEELEAFCDDMNCKIEIMMEARMAKKHIYDIMDSQNYREKVNKWRQEIVLYDKERVKKEAEVAR